MPSLEARNGQKAGTHTKMNFGEAFGLAPRPYARAATGMSASAASYDDSGSGHGPSRRGTGQGNAGESVSLGAVRARGLVVVEVVEREVRGVGRREWDVSRAESEDERERERRRWVVWIVLAWPEGECE